MSDNLTCMKINCILLSVNQRVFLKLFDLFNKSIFKGFEKLNTTWYVGLNN